MGEKMGIKGMDTWKTWDDAYAHQMAYEVTAALRVTAVPPLRE